MHWRQQLRRNFTNVSKLADFLELNDQQRSLLLERPRFILNLPFRLAEKIEKSNLNDPILRQFVPLNDESVVTQGFLKDPVGDSVCRKEAKLLHKYQGRVLLVCTSACAMHCRYCFRQNFDYDVQDKAFAEELSYIENDSSIKEVILSGGDPLSLPETILEPLLLRLAKIPHLRRIRFHSRFPIGIPERIDEGFLALLEQLPQQIWFILHCNHPRELDAEIFAKIHQLQQRRVIVGNQAVLLKGVNDRIDVLKELCENLVDQGVLPYYLHQLDRVQGAAHFEVPESVGIQLIQELITQLPGYAIPKFVRETAGHPSKTPIVLSV